MEGEPSFLPLLLIAALAALIPFLSYRLTGGIVPAVVGEVVIGIIFGEPLLGLLGHSEWLDFLALFGFAYLMFLSGLEINLNVLTTSPGPRWYLPHVALRHPLISGLLFMGLTIGATYLALRVLWEIDFIDLSHKPMLLFIFIATSVGVLVPVLKDRPDLGAMAQAVLVGGFLVEFVAIVGVGVVAALDRTGVGWEMGLLAAMPVALALLVWAAKSGGGRFPIIGRTLHELADTSASTQDSRRPGRPDRLRRTLRAGRHRVGARRVPRRPRRDRDLAAARLRRARPPRRPRLWILRPHLLHPRRRDARFRRRLPVLRRLHRRPDFPAHGLPHQTRPRPAHARPGARPCATDSAAARCSAPTSASSSPPAPSPRSWASSTRRCSAP